MKLKQELLGEQFVIGNLILGVDSVSHDVLMALKILPVLVEQFLVVIGKQKVVGVKRQEWPLALILLI